MFIKYSKWREIQISFGHTNAFIVDLSVAFRTSAFVATRGVDALVLAAAVVLVAFVDICQEKKTSHVTPDSFIFASHLSSYQYNRVGCRSSGFPR